MKLQERSYSTKILRPKPFIHTEEDGSLIVLATSWGQTEHAQKVIEEVVKYVNAAKSDVEVTSPFEFLTCFTDEVNYVRNGVLIANEILYRGENKSQYISGVEVLVLFRNGSQLAWAQVGCPSLFIQRNNQSLQPLSIGLDLSSELIEAQVVQPPLPSQLLGLDPTCYVQCGHTQIKEEDQLILLASSLVAPSLWQKTFANIDMEYITRNMIQDNPETPFWLGLVHF
ncbi:MAG: hypothetical protein ACXVCY_16120 [Pseudobdellovibrionaceae bacterium]